MGKRGVELVLLLILFLVVFSLSFVSAYYNSTVTVESTNDVGQSSSVAIDSNNKIHISNSLRTANDVDDLRYCNNTASNGAWSCTRVDSSAQQLGQYTSIAIDSNNKVHIAHRNATGANLKYCNNTASNGAWSCATVESPGSSVGSTPSLAIDSNNKAHVSHYDITNSDVRYCNNTASNGDWSCVIIDASAGTTDQDTSLAIDSNNKVHISYSTGANLKYCNNTASNGAWSCTSIETTTSVSGTITSIAIDSNNKVHIAHQDENVDLKYCNNTASNGAWSCTTLDSTSTIIGDSVSLAIDSNNKVHISYSDNTNTALKYCNNINDNWVCVRLIGTDSNQLGFPMRGIAIKKGRLVDSTSSSDLVHISWYNNTDLMYTQVDPWIPGINITTPLQNNTNSSNINLDINSTISDTNLNDSWYSNDTYSVNISLRSGANFLNITDVTWSEGKHNVTIYVNDSGGNLNFSTISFTIDSIAPDLNITIPEQNNSNTTNANLNVNYTRSDANLASCWYSNDTYLVNTTLANCANVTTITWSQGKHNVTIWVNDSAGNLNFSTISFTIDTVAPDINITIPFQNNTNTTNANLNVNYTRSDANLASCWYSNDTYLVNTTLTNCGNITDVTWSQGKHNITIYTNDSANNLNFSTISFTIDTTSPTASAVCSPSQVNTGEIVTCTCSPSDSLSGVDSSLTSIITNPSTINTGTFSVSCSFADYAGNTGSTTAQYTVEQGGSGGGGTGGGGGGSILGESQTTTETEPVSEKKYTFDSIIPESTETIFDFDSEALIKEIQIQVKEQTQNVEINVKTYDSKPREISKEKEGIVYRYLRIDVQNLDNKLEEAKIKFQIKKNSSDENFDKNEIALFKFDEVSETWNELNTGYSDEDENYYYYESVLNSFSYFAIGKKTAKIREEFIDEEIEKGFDFDKIKFNIPRKDVLSGVYFIIGTIIILIVVLMINFAVKKIKEKPKISYPKTNRIIVSKPKELFDKDFNK